MTWACSVRTSLQRARQQQAAAQAEVSAPDLQVDLSLTGLAPTDVDVAHFISALGAHMMFDQVNLQVSEQTRVDDLEMRKFRVNMTVNRDVTFREIEPTLVKRELKIDPLGDTIQSDATGQLVTPTVDLVADGLPSNQGD